MNSVLQSIADHRRETLASAELSYYRLVHDLADGDANEPERDVVAEILRHANKSPEQAQSDLGLLQQSRHLAAVAGDIDNRRAELEQARAVHSDALEAIDVEIRQRRSKTRGNSNISVAQAGEAMNAVARLQNERSTKGAELDTAIRAAEFRVNESQQAGREFRSLVQANPWLIEQQANEAASTELVGV